MRYFKLFWDCLYAMTLGSMAAAGFAVSSLCVKKIIADHKKESESWTKTLILLKLSTQVTTNSDILVSWKN